MQQNFTKQFMADNCGCYKPQQLADCSFMQSDPVRLESILNSEIPLKDKFWFVCKKLATKGQNQQIAIGVAEIVLEIYESKYPDNTAPREAIQADKDYLAGTGITLEQLKQARRNAAAAAAYAAAAAAAYAAAAAAYAAAAAAAAYAADAADAYAAADA
ncbi:MAG: hypothetical protein V4560_15075, partial [Bacteroidota bacterium]